jgi:hypothetical protein
MLETCFPVIPSVVEESLNIFRLEDGIPATPGDKRVRIGWPLHSTGKMPVGPTARMAVLLTRARASSPLQMHIFVLED